MAKIVDSTIETNHHIDRVRYYILMMLGVLARRSINHDASKLQEPEKSFFDKYRPVLSSMPYDSPEYMKALAELKPALEHHYQNNSHHPEHYPNGINDMNLFDLLEMLADWKAAVEKNPDGDIAKSLELNIKRFNISPELTRMLTSTLDELGWI